MQTHGRQPCPLPGCDYVMEDYSPSAPGNWACHLLLHIFYESTTLPEGVK